MSDYREPYYLTMARYYGAEAARTASTWLELTPSDAESIVTDVDPAVLDRYPGPNLSGEWADDPTPSSLAWQIAADGNDDGRVYFTNDQIDDIARVWEESADTFWSDLLDAAACRVLGRDADADRAYGDLSERLNNLAQASDAAAEQ